MSLLLDALKKAAQQKAQKSKSEAPVERATDETLLDAGTGRTAPARGRDDETEFDHSEINARLERGSVVRGGGDDTGLELPDRTDARVRAERPAGEDTGLDLPDSTDARIEAGRRPAAGDDTGLEVPGDELAPADLSEQLQSGDDETIVFESEDASDFVVEQAALTAGAARAEDETDLGQLDDGEALTGIGSPRTGAEMTGKPGADDETDLSQPGERGEATGIGKAPAERVEVTADRVGEEPAGGNPQAAEGEETDLGQASHEAAESARRELADDSDSTDFQQPALSVEQIEPAEAQRRPDVDADASGAAPDSGRGLFDEDLSLLLLEPDPTNPRLAEDTSFSSPRMPGTTGRAFAAGAGDAGDSEELALVDTTQTRTGAEPTDTEGPTLTNPSETALFGDETRTVEAAVGRGKPARGDATSTRTYAPDNYDRTLMKLPRDDASKLFAGMKSDSDVVMTPDYAKKVFRSKTSAQRVQHYKLYGGIGLAIVLAIGIYGVVQYQDESLRIDTGLRPLKRDPMPGVIKMPKEQENGLFDGSDSEVTARTIEIIETAEATGASDTADTGEPGSDAVEAAAIIAPQETAPAPTSGAVESASAASTRSAAPEGQVAQGDSAGPAAAPAEPAASATSAVEPVAGEQVASLTQPRVQQSSPQQSSPQQAAEPAGNLQIKTNSQYRQTDLWLREAYAAYRAGDDQQALRLYNQVVEADPGNRNALLARAAINMHNGDVDAAIRDYQALLLANPKDSLALASLLAVASFSPLETESQLKLMLYDEPDSPFLNFALANAYGAQNRWQEAQQYYFKALQTNPQDPNYAYNLAVSLEHISQPGSAVTYYRRALDNFDNGLATFDREIVIQRLERLKNL